MAEVTGTDPWSLLSTTLCSLSAPPPAAPGTILTAHHHHDLGKHWATTHEHGTQTSPVGVSGGKVSISAHLCRADTEIRTQVWNRNRNVNTCTDVNVNNVNTMKTCMDNSRERRERKSGKLDEFSGPQVPPYVPISLLLSQHNEEGQP